MTRIPVKVSAACMRQLLHPCEPEFIANVCHAHCCESTLAPQGMFVTIHPGEQAAIERLGGVVNHHFLESGGGPQGAGRCPFKTTENLCGLHHTGFKPFGCATGPFTLNANDTLIVRNRYRILKCYRAPGSKPAYVAHRESLARLFGGREAARIARHLDRGGGDLMANMPEGHYRILHDNDEYKRGAPGTKSARVR